MFQLSAPYRTLYYLVAAGALMLVAVALGGGLTGSSGHWLGHWQHQAFRMLCHQDPQRSFWVMGTPMAICSRCFGIYSLFATAWITMPGWGRWYPSSGSRTHWMLGMAVLINVADIIGNLLGFWENTLISRWLVGGSVGLMVALLFAGDLITTTKQAKGAYYE